MKRLFAALAAGMLALGTAIPAMPFHAASADAPAPAPVERAASRASALPAAVQAEPPGICYSAPPVEPELPETDLSAYSAPETGSLTDKASSRYGRTDLKKRFAKGKAAAFYDMLIAESEYLMYSADDLAVSGEICAAAVYSLEELGLSQDEASAVYTVFRYDNPAYYFTSGKVYVSESAFYFCIPAEYADGAVRSELREEIEAYVLSFAKEMAPKTVFGKVLNVCERLEWNMVADDQIGTAAYSVVGAAKYGRGACEAYVQTFALILNYYGLNQILVSGTFGSGEELITSFWNMVRMDDGNYYYIDIFHIASNHNVTELFCWGTTQLSHLHVLHSSDEKGEAFLYDLPEVPDERFVPPGDTVTDDGLLRYSVSYNGRATVTGYIGAPATLVIPEKVGDARVYAIAPNAFSHCSSLRSVSFPASLHKIGDIDSGGGDGVFCVL